MIEIKKGVIVSPQLAPPAIPTGTIPADTCGVIGEKTDVYLDLCNQYALGQIYMLGWGGIFWIGGLSSLIMGGIKNFMTSHIFIIFALLLSPIFIGMIVALFKCPPPPTLRFNRQRRELYIRYKVGHKDYYKKALWEDVSAKTFTAHAATPSGKIKQSALIISIPNTPTNAQNNEEIIFSVSCGTPQAGMMLWEYIRTFMEFGPNDWPENNRSATSELHLLFNQFKSKDIRGALWTVFRIVTLGSLIVDLYDRWKSPHKSPITAPEVLNWSAPIPKELWCTRTQGLNEAIQKAQSLINHEGNGIIQSINDSI